MVQSSVRSFVFTIILLSRLIGASGDEGGLRLDEKLRALLDNTRALQDTGIPTDLYTASPTIRLIHEPLTQIKKVYLNLNKIKYLI